MDTTPSMVDWACLPAFLPVLIYAVIFIPACMVIEARMCKTKRLCMDERTVAKGALIFIFGAAICCLPIWNYFHNL